MSFILYIFMGMVVFTAFKLVVSSGIFTEKESQDSENKISYIPSDESSIKKIYNAKFLLDTKWEIIPDDYWISLKEEPISNEFAFDVEDIVNEVGLDKISDMVNEFESGKIFYFAGSFEYGIADSLDLSKYPDDPVYYTNADASWVVYRTDEDTIAFGGTDLIAHIQSKWTDYERYLNPWDNAEEMD